LKLRLECPEAITELTEFRALLCSGCSAELAAALLAFCTQRFDLGGQTAPLLVGLDSGVECRDRVFVAPRENGPRTVGVAP
jgi:DNA-directed RNA polymerase subunit RPC12/RpoP